MLINKLPNSNVFNIQKNNWTNPNLFPDMLYVDTNIVIDLIFQRNNFQQIEDYLQELPNKNSMIVWSPHTRKEVINVLHVEALKNFANNNSILDKHNTPAWKVAENTIKSTDAKVLYEEVLQDTEQLFTYLSNFGLEGGTIDSNRLNNLTYKIYGEFNVPIKDAEHISYSNLYGTNNILTQDSGFLRCPSLNIFGSTNKIKSLSKIPKKPNNFFDFNNLIVSQGSNNIKDAK